MKNFLIFLSIMVVTILAVADFRQRMAELDSISKETQAKIEMQKSMHSNSVIDKTVVDIDSSNTKK